MTITSSRLSPNLNDIISDPLLLTYFTHYLQDVEYENLFRFWLEMSGCISRRTIIDQTNDYPTEEISVGVKELNVLRQRMAYLPVTDATTIYFRYLSSEAKLPVELPIELVCSSLVFLLENPLNILSLYPCFRYAESCLRDDIFPNFLHSDIFKQFQREIVLNEQLKLDDILFDDHLLVRFVEFLAGEPISILMTFMLAVNAYKKEYIKLMSLSENNSISIDERHQQLLHDATTICAKYLSPASEDFMGLDLEQYRDVLDAACSEKEPRIECFDELYSIIHHSLEKKVVPSFFTSTPFLRYRSQFDPKSVFTIQRVKVHKGNEVSDYLKRFEEAKEKYVYNESGIGFWSAISVNLDGKNHNDCENISTTQPKYVPKPKAKTEPKNNSASPSILDATALSKAESANQIPSVYIKANAQAKRYTFEKNIKFNFFKSAFSKN